MVTIMYIAFIFVLIVLWLINVYMGVTRRPSKLKWFNIIGIPLVILYMIQRLTQVGG
jgi:hypothetical protein